MKRSAALRAAYAGHGLVRIGSHHCPSEVLWRGPLCFCLSAGSCRFVPAHGVMCGHAVMCEQIFHKVHRIVK
jgi:hypothetical protein